MRPFTAALLGLAVALPLGIATVPAHADQDANGFFNRAQKFFDQSDNQNDRDNYRRDHNDNWQRSTDNDQARRYGWNENGQYDRGDRGDRDNAHGEWRRPGDQYGYNNGDEHRWDNNGLRNEHHYGDNDHADTWRGDHD